MSIELVDAALVHENLLMPVTTMPEAATAIVARSRRSYCL
jgi:hypothetical protein